MASRQGEISGQRATAGDAAVDGLFHGLGAGLVMAALLIALGLLEGEGPLVILGYFSASAAVAPWIGLVSHLAVSGIYGLLFGLLLRPVMRRFQGPAAHLLAGIIYGLLLFALAEWVILPGSGSHLREIPSLNFAAAHLLYGLTLGLWSGRAHPTRAAA